MTLMGKILTVLILFMSVLFMGFSICIYATHKNWEADAKASKEKVKVQQDINDQLRKSRDELERTIAQERVARRTALQVLESRNANVTQTLTQQRARINTLINQERDVRERLRILVAELVRYQTDNSNLRTAIVKVRQSRNDQFGDAQKATDEVNKLSGELVAFKNRNNQLAFLLAQGKSTLDKLGINPASVTHLPHKVDGKVKAVGKTYVEISLGSDDGLKVGHELDVIRDNGTYVGRIVIRNIKPDRAVGEVLKAYRQTPIKNNDRVVTKKT